MNRIRSVRHLEEGAGQPNQILEPERFELEFSAKLAKLSRNGIVEKIIAGDDRYRDIAVRVLCAETAEKAQTVDERHPEVEDDRIRMTLFSFAKPGFRIHGGPHFVTFKPEHACEGLRYPLIVVDDEDLGRLALCHGGCVHFFIVTDGLFATRTDKPMLHLGVFYP